MSNHAHNSTQVPHGIDLHEPSGSSASTPLSSPVQSEPVPSSAQESVLPGQSDASSQAPRATGGTKSASSAPSWRWTTADIALGAALGVACGLVFWGFNFLYMSVLSPVLGAILPGLASVFHAFWYFSGPLAVLIIRKPGAAIYVNIVGAAAEMILGNEFAFSFVFISAAMQGLFSEMPFALTGYRTFNLPMSIASGALTALEYGFYLLFFRYQAVSPFSPRGIIHIISELVGGVLFAGVLSWFLFQAIARTGALDHFASGRAVRGYQD